MHLGAVSNLLSLLLYSIQCNLTSTRSSQITEALLVFLNTVSSPLPRCFLDFSAHPQAAGDLGVQVDAIRPSDHQTIRPSFRPNSSWIQQDLYLTTTPISRSRQRGLYPFFVSPRRTNNCTMSPSLNDRLLWREAGHSLGNTALRGIYGDRSLVEDLDIVNELGGHSGCVNALRYRQQSPNGHGRMC